MKILTISVFILMSVVGVEGVFEKMENVEFVSAGRTAGIAVADVDLDGALEFIVAVPVLAEHLHCQTNVVCNFVSSASKLNGPNLVIKYDPDLKKYVSLAERGTPYEAIMDPNGRTVSVAACDIDGDGKEEIYLHNINPVYPRPDDDITVDKLLIWRAGGYIDLFSDPRNLGLAPEYGGQSVTCVDPRGLGTYSFLVTTYTHDGKGTYRLLGMNDSHPANNVGNGYIVLADLTDVSGLRVVRDGRGAVAGPILGSRGYSDIYVTNDNSYHVGSATFRHSGKNVLFRNNGDGTFTDVAEDLGVTDQDENGRSVALGQFGGDDHVDMAYLNWLGANRVFVQNSSLQHCALQNAPSDEFALPGPSAIMMVADFDNDGQTDVLKGGADDDSLYPISNQFLHIGDVTGNHSSRSLDPPELRSLHLTGISASDQDGDGRLEVLVAHRLAGQISLAIYQSANSRANNWIRFLPKTKSGAPARGSKVTITLTNDQSKHHVIGGGCGYLCQSEPVAHFGTGSSFVREVTVQWPDGHAIRSFLYPRNINKSYMITYTGNMNEIQLNKDTTFDPSSSYGVNPGCGLPLTLIVLVFHFLQANLCSSN